MKTNRVRRAFIAALKDNKAATSRRTRNGCRITRRRRAVIFEQLRDTRSARSWYWSLTASLIINGILLTTLVIAAQVSATRNNAGRVMDLLNRELRKYKLVLILPVMAPPKDNPVAARPIKPATRPPKPLQTPDFRIVNRLDPQIAEVVKENPEIERILTREIVRDIDAKVIDLGRLLQKSSLRLSFEIDENGRATRRRVERSSTVSSIDNLFLELVVLLEKYQFLAPMKGLRRVFASVIIDRQVEVRFEGDAADEAAAEEVRKQLQNVLTLMRFALPKEDAAFVLENVNLVVQGKQVVLSKNFEKDPLVAYLMQYYRAEPRPEPPRPPADVPPSRLVYSRFCGENCRPLSPQSREASKNHKIIAILGIGMVRNRITVPFSTGSAGGD